MNIKRPTIGVLLVLAAALSSPVHADTYVIPFADIQQIIDSSEDTPDAAIRAYLAGLIRDELDALGFDVNAGLVLDNIPLDAITETIATSCILPRPYKVHTDATTAAVTLDETSSLTVDLDSIRSIELNANLSGVLDTQADAWVRWGQDVPFFGSCKTINTDNGWVGLTLPLDIDLSLSLDLDPTYDPEQLAIVVDKHATLTGQALLTGGDLDHDFGSFSLTDALISIFEDQLLEDLQANGEQAVADAIIELNYRLDGLDENGDPDPTITPFNGPTVFALSIEEDDKAFVRDLLAQLGVPEYLIEILDERGIDILLQLALLEGAEREAYLAELGATVSCDVLLAAFETPLDSTPIYTFDGQACTVADLANPAAGTYFTDSMCTYGVAYSPTDDAEYCQTRFGDQAETLLGNAAGWTADTNQPNDALPGVASRAWTTTPSTQLDVGVIPLQGNHQPFMKQLGYKTIVDLPRGNGSCELEMRVYKSDITEQNLKPLMALHGGTWQHRGFSFFGLEAGVSQLTERGFIVFAPFYRLVGESDGNVECNGGSWRQVTEDVESALDWIAENGAALGAADGPVSIYGQSAGAHLAAWLAAHRSQDVRKALMFYAPTDVLDFLAGAIPAGGQYEAYRSFGTRSIGRLYGASNVTQELRLDQIDFAGITVDQLSEDWTNVVPASVFDLSQLDGQAPPAYLARCAAATAIDLSVVDLSLPPEALTECLKQDLGEFLVENSFNHLLDDEAVPIHIVHGSGDTLVPYTQAIGLCEAIDGNAQPATVTEPLTTYACGVASEVQIVKDAEHALELGVCLDSLCPAGEIGSETRAAAETAMNVAYNWLLVDPPLPPPDAVAILALPDINGNGSPEMGVLLHGAEYYVDIRDSVTSASIGVLDFGSAAAIDAAVMPDLDGNGFPEIALLGELSSGEARAVIRDSATGALIGQPSYGSSYRGVDMAVLADYSGNGLPELAVMGVDSLNRVRVQVKEPISNAVLSTLWYGNKASALKLTTLQDSTGNGVDELYTHGEVTANGTSRGQVRDPSTTLYHNTIFFTKVYETVTVVGLPDINGTGAPDVAELGQDPASGKVLVQVRDASEGAPPIRSMFLGSGSEAIDMISINDTNGNGQPDLAVLLRSTDGTGFVKIRDSLTGDNIRNIYFGAVTNPIGIVALDDFNANGRQELAVLGKNGLLQRVQIRDSQDGAQINNVEFP